MRYGSKFHFSRPKLTVELTQASLCMVLDGISYSLVFLPQLIIVRSGTPSLQGLPHSRHVAHASHHVVQDGDIQNAAAHVCTGDN